MSKAHSAIVLMLLAGVVLSDLHAEDLAPTYDRLPSTGESFPLDSTAFVQTGSYPFRFSQALVMDTVRNVAFVAQGAGVYVIDVSDPTNPRILSDRIRCQGGVSNLWLDHQRLYVAIFSYSVEAPVDRELEIWDVAQPDAPELLGSVETFLGVRGVWAEDSLLVLGGFQHILTLDVRDPANPVRLDSLVIGSPAVEMFYKMDSLLLTSENAGLVGVYSIADPTNVRSLGYWTGPSEYPGLAVDGSTMYVVGGYGPLGPRCGLWMFDIMDPLHGVLIGAFDTVSRNCAYRVSVADTIALVTYRSPIYSTTAATLKLVSVADPANPRELASYGGVCTGVAVRDTLAYVAFQGRFEVLDIAHPAGPVSISRVLTGLTGVDVAVDRGIVYSVGQNLSVLDARGPGDIELLGCLEATAYSIAHLDTLVVLIADLYTDSVRMLVVGVGDPTNPHLLAQERLHTRFASAVMRDTLAYVATDTGIIVYDLANPRQPREVGSLRMLVSPTTTVLAGDLALIAGSNLTVANVADPARPCFVSQHDIAAYRMAVKDTFLYVTEYFQPYLGIYDLRNPAQLPMIAEFSLGHSGGGAFALQDTLLVATYMDGMCAFSIADPVLPRILGSTSSATQVHDVALDDGTVYTSDVVRYLLVPIPVGVTEQPESRGGFGSAPTVVRGVLYLLPSPYPLPAGEGQGVRERSVLLDAAGRSVMELQAGPNDVRHLAPGVYSVRERVSGAGVRTASTRS